jgi:DNA-binding NtrC family response regulator
MKKHILIVDDEASILELLGAYLTNAGYRVTAVSTAYKAEEVAAKDKPDLVISDLQLENSDGLELIARLKSGLPDTPMILLTGVLFDAKFVHENLAKKVSCYIEKTSPLSRILGEVQRLLAS